MTIMDQSLCLLDGVSPEAEARFRRVGVLTCRQLADDAERFFSSSHALRVRTSFEEMSKALSCGLVDWFVNHLPVGQRIRALLPFLPRVTFYDIETDGTSPSSQIVCISTLKGGTYKTFVRGRNLLDFLDVWSTTQILVGFNSKRFDTPHVCRTFGLSNIPAQVDLMDESRHWGYRGGLKTIERVIGFERKAVECSNGLDAITLWNKYVEERSGSALEQLLVYNREDVRSLLFLSAKLLQLSCAFARLEQGFQKCDFQKLFFDN